MKILQMDVNYGHSSTGKIVKDLQTALISNGHDCMVAYGRGESVTSREVVRIASWSEVAFHAAMTRLTGVTGYFSPFATSKAKRLLDDFRPHVLHLHELHGYYINFDQVLRYARRIGCKTVWTFHCEFPYTGKCGNALDCVRWKVGCGSCPQLNEYPKSVFIDATRWMLTRKKKLFGDLQDLTITTPSEWLSGRVRESIAGSHRVVTIPNPIDTSIFRIRENGRGIYQRFGVDASIVILTVGSNIMSPLKGGKFVYEIANLIKRKDIHFVIVGDDCVGGKASSNVTSIGRVKDKNELAALYSAADLTLLPSRSETFSMVCAESLACGTPIIGFDSGAPPLVAPAAYGRFASYSDVQTLADWIDSFEVTRASMKSKSECSKFATSCYGVQTVISKYIDVYES